MESPLCPPDDPGFRLIETFRWEPGRGVIRRDRHLSRLMGSARHLGIAPVGVEEALGGISGPQPLRVRLSVDRAGRAGVTTAPFTPLADGAVWRVGIAEQRLDSTDPWLRHKTTHRQLYDDARANMPDWADELIFLNERGELCEGTITNLFTKAGRGFLTPALSSGLLPGVLREEMLCSGGCVQSVLTTESLQAADAVYVGNSLRGLIRAELLLRL